MLLNEIAPNQQRSDTSITAQQFVKPNFQELYNGAQQFEGFRGMSIKDFVDHCRIGKAVHFSRLKDYIPLPTNEDVAPQQHQLSQSPRPTGPLVMPVIVQSGPKYALLSGGEVLVQCQQNSIDAVCWLVQV